ncbi:MAG: gamma carbonic anhydrase family protein [Myxococcota bacterium]
MSGPRIESYQHHHPVIDEAAWIHPDAVIIGQVVLAAGVNVWPGVILRGDQGGIFIGEETNLQDGTIAHATGGMSETHIGRRVTVGHRVILHGCVVEDECLIGMGAIVMDNARVGEHSIIGAGAVVTVGRPIPPRSMVVGVPARVVRQITDEEVDRLIHHGHQEYTRLMQDYRGGG